ncbi:MAG: hypothetical protein E7237_08585 [Sarcina sp.]|nr:hypothetical protein [Sarcina sp.]
MISEDETARSDHFISRILKNPVYCGELVYGRRTNKKDKDGRLVRQLIECRNGRCSALS